MKTKQYKTNINCLGCVEKVTPILNPLVGENNWEVNIRDKNKILTVTNENLNEPTLIEQIKKAGFNIETIK
ncbi:heavy-metal-associated domain-containing protein [Flavobacterium urocaniciphilum]|uniref:Copper chaperone CopZ n=1 Tax=Flavobacterium urocaniciphilum TaxID=1299341 RepID=A0A1H8ZR43_9FLAO|nr:heavy-metal-associated domain-containing protein [Flavobacterium urocaniciphilum]SEP66845.1 Copper chaperone CopZ [Flavobacterium urocaniciphilum]